MLDITSNGIIVYHYVFLLTQPVVQFSLYVHKSNLKPHVFTQPLSANSHCRLLEKQAVAAVCLCWAYVFVQLRYIVGFGLIEIVIWIYSKPTTYHNLYENTGLD